MSRLLRLLSYLLVFVTFWLLWPRELDGYLGKMGDAIVPDYSMQNSRYVSVKDGKREVEMYSNHSSFDFIARLMKADAVTIYFYDTEQQKTVVTANNGEFFMDEKRFHLVGDVRSTSPDGFVLTGPQVNYLVNTKHLNGPEPVYGEMQDKSLKIWGDRVEGDMDSKKIWLYGDARAHFQEKRHGLTKITGDEALLDRNISQVNFYKNVHTEQDKTIGTAQRAELNYSSQDKALHYMSLLDDVKIVELDSKRYTRSQVAEFFSPSDTIVLTGFPSVYDGDDAVTGDKITLYRTTGVVEVVSTNAAAKEDDLGKKQKKSKSNPEDDELIP